jgi:hypothetical protein
MSAALIRRDLAVTLKQHQREIKKMSKAEKLLRDIEALRDAIEIEFDDLASNPLREVERESLRSHIESCQTELRILLHRLTARTDEEVK